eukprot:1143612_1
MSSDRLHSTKISPTSEAEAEADKDIDVTDADLETVITEAEAEVPKYGELKTTLQTPSPDGSFVPESFSGTDVDLSKSPFPVNNEFFEGFIHIMMRDLPNNTYDSMGRRKFFGKSKCRANLKENLRGLYIWQWNFHKMKNTKSLHLYG